MSKYNQLGILQGNKNNFSEVFVMQGLSFEEATKRYQKRRASFLKGLKHPSIIFGYDGSITSEVWHSLRTPINQDPLMMYLTGINQSNCALFLDPKNNKEILFITKRDRLREFGFGTSLGVDEGNADVVKTLVGVEDVRLFEQMDYYVSKIIDENDISCLGVMLHDGYDLKKNETKLLEDTNYRSFHSLKEKLEKRGKNLRYYNIHDYQLEQRLSLDEVDVANMKKANEIHGQALQKILKNMKNYTHENQIHAELVHHYLSTNGTKGEASSPICCGGKNATCLHYTKNDDPLTKGELVLIDCGVKVGSMMSDVTRVFPVNGVFNPMQKILYNIVLDVQKEVEKQLKAGVLWFDLDAMTWNFIQSALKERFASIGGTYELLYDVKPHGLGHLLGEMIHDGDIFRNYQKTPAKEGWVFTNEPGLYGHFKVTIDGVSYDEWVGIRIEDNLLVTKDGCVNLTSMIPKEIEDIEKQMSNK